MEYKIYPTLYSEIRKGTVWSEDKIDTNLVKIKNLVNDKTIIVAHRQIDPNFKRFYKESKYTKDIKRESENEKCLVIDEFYRKKLKLNKNKIEYLEIKPIQKCKFFYNLKYLSSHPNEVVQITFWFTLFTFLFSFITYFLPLDKLCNCISKIFL